MSWLIVALSAGFVVGLVLLVVGLRGRRVGDEPRCRKCKYDLTGLDSDRCPECGHAITQKTTVHGFRRRRRALWLPGALLMAVSLSVAGYGGYQAAQWKTYRDYPVFMLRWKAANGDFRAANALNNRIRRGALQPEQLRSFADTAIDQYTKAVAPPRIGFTTLSQAQLEWAQLLESLIKAGLLDARQQRKLVEHCFAFGLTYRPRVRQNEVLGLSVALAFNGLTSLPFETSSTWQVRVDGGVVNHESAQDWPNGRYNFSSWSNRESMLAKWPPGRHDISLTVQTHVTPGEGGADWEAFDRTSDWSGTFEVLPADAPDPLEIVDDEATRDAFISVLKVSMTMQGRGGFVDDDLIWMRVDNTLPVPMTAVFKAVLESDTGELSSMYIRFEPDDPQFMCQRYFPFKKSLLHPGVEYTPVLRPDLRAARSTPDIMRVFGGELRFEPFTIEEVLAVETQGKPNGLDLTSQPAEPEE